MVGFCFYLSERDILCVHNGEKMGIGNICSLMFFIHVFIKVLKNMFIMFFICKSMFLTFMF